MPKVTPEYIDNKRKEIVDAAYRVCLRKPAEVVTISDVIAETGMSQGAIYRYYPGLDEIFSDMVSGMRHQYNIIDRLNEIILDKSSSFEEITYNVCDCLGEVMEDHLMDIQKINFDMGVLAINEPERASKIMADIKGPGNMEYLGFYVFPKMVKTAIESGYKPHGSTQELQAFISSAYTGIEKYCILGACYGSAGPGTKIEPRVLFKTLAKTIILLIGGKT